MHATTPARASRELMAGIHMGECPRWHDGRFWFSDWVGQTLYSVDENGEHRAEAHVASLPFAVDWTSDGRMLLLNAAERKLLQREADGSFTTRTDLAAICPHGTNEVVVDGRGNIYVNGGCTFEPAEGEAPGGIAVVTPDGSVRQVADQIAFPNGMVVTPDNSTLVIAESFARRLTAFDIADGGSLSNRRVWADGVGPDGICMDADGAIWTDAGEFTDTVVGRVLEGGEVLERVHLDMPCFACMLGSENRETLFMMTADWRMSEGFAENIARLTGGPRTGRVLTATAPAPGVGWP